MARRLDFKRWSGAALMTASLLATGVLAACGESSGTSTVVLTGPGDKVQAMIKQDELLAPLVQAQLEQLDGGRQRATLTLPRALPMKDVSKLGSEAAQAGIEFKFSSSRQWGSSKPPQTGPAKNATPARSGGTVA